MKIDLEHYKIKLTLTPNDFNICDFQFMLRNPGTVLKHQFYAQKPRCSEVAYAIKIENRAQI